MSFENWGASSNVSQEAKPLASEVKTAKMFVTRRASLRRIIQNINLSEIESALMRYYKYVPGKPGRPPLSPTGMFLSFLLMFLRMESYSDYRAFRDRFWRRILGFKESPDIGSFTRFLQRVGIDAFEQLFQSVVHQLLDEGFLNLHFIAQDGSILEANNDDQELGMGSRRRTICVWI